MSTFRRRSGCAYAYATRMAPVRDGERYAEFDRWLAEIRAEALAPIRAALDGHPVCDVRPDGGIPSCGWKRAVADVRRALDA